MKPPISKQETITITWPIWRDERQFYFDADSICGAFAMWAVRQSPYSCPEGIENAILLLHASWIAQFGEEFILQSGNEIEKWLLQIFQEISIIKNWNKAKNHDREYVFISSHHDKPKPDDDIIDLHALARNITHTLLLERLYEEGTP